MDFSYEVSRSLAACDGALLVVDATQGVEAQSVANCYTATELGLEVVPVINKIDLPSADPARVIKEIEEIIGIPADDALMVSGKTGEGVEELIEQLIERIPPPKGDPDAPLQALIVDSWFDNYVGVVTLVRIVNGTLKVNDKIRVMSTGRAHQVDKLGRFTPKSVPARELGPGDVGFVIAGIKEIDGAPVGDTITLEYKQATEPLPGFKQVQPRVFAGMFPIVSDDYDKFRDALSKLRLNDSALHYEPEVSGALGFGFRVGFLGLLHMDIVQERLEREYEIELITQRADGDLRSEEDRWRGLVRRQPDQTTAGGPHRRAARAHHHRQHPRAARPRRRRAASCATRSAAGRRRCCTSATRSRCSTRCRSPKWCSISSTA